MLQVQEVLISSSDTKPITKLRDVVGLIATRNVRKNQTVFTDDVQQPYVIERGQLVTVRALVGGMVIRTTARSMGDGAVDDLIQLQNERSREPFMARVIGPREALLDNGTTSGELSLAGRTK
jgi:flagella basal body P-ring formation protein FlgA